MKKFGIICAMQKEAQQLMDRLTVQKKINVGPFEFVQASLNGKEIILAQSGMGKVNAALGAVEMIYRFKPDALISSGVAGGLAKQLKPLDCVVGTQYVYHDVWCGTGNEYGQVQGLPTFFNADKKLVAAADKIGTQEGHTVHKGLICTGDQFISGEEAVERILKHFPQALACDMESAAIAQVCYRHHTPFISMRLLSDVAGKAEDNMSQYENFWETMADQGFARTWALLTALTQEVNRAQ